MPPEGDYNSRGAADNLLTGLKKYPEIALNSALLVYGSGDGGGGPNEIHHEVTRRERNLRGLPRVEYSIRRRLLPCPRAARDRPHPRRRALPRDPPGHVHDAGRRSSAATASSNASCTRSRRSPCSWATTAGPCSRSTGETCCCNQFHDILPGSSIARVNREAVETYARIEGALDAYADELVGRLPRAERDAVGAEPHEPAAQRVREDGRRLVPGGGGSVCGGPADARGRPPGARLGGGHAGQRHPHPDVRRASGEIVSCLDRDGAEHAADGLNRLVVHKDPYVWPFNAWDIKADYMRQGAADAPRDARRDHGRRPAGRAPTDLPRTRRHDRPARRPRGRQRRRAIRDRGRLAREAPDAACRVPACALRRDRAVRDPVRTHRARHHRARLRREGPVRDLRAQVDRHARTTAAGSPCSTTASTGTGPRAAC